MSWRARILLQFFLAVTLLLAPLLCVWFCQIRHTVAQSHLAHAGEVQPHESDLVAWVAEFNQQHAGHAHATLHYDGIATQSAPSHAPLHRPMDDMKQIMLSVTEFIATTCVLALVLIMLGRIFAIAASPTPRLVRVPVPPPKASFR